MIATVHVDLHGITAAHRIASLLLDSRQLSHERVQLFPRTLTWTSRTIGGSCGPHAFGVSPLGRLVCRGFFAGLTSLSKAHLESLMVLSGRYHVTGFAEHKVTEDRIESVQARFSAMGHKSWWIQARRTDAGVSGGTSLHIKKCFKGHRVDWASLPKGKLPHVEPRIWTAVIIQGLINFVVISAYF